MQSPSSPANQYLANKVMTASPQELTLMLYDGAIKFLNRSLVAIDSEDIEEAHKSLVKAQNIIEEFMIVVDRKIEVGNNLFLMYDYMYRRLVEANIKKDKDIVNEVMGLIRELRESWKIAMDKDKGIYKEPDPVPVAPEQIATPVQETQEETTSEETSIEEANSEETNTTEEIGNVTTVVNEEVKEEPKPIVLEEPVKEEPKVEEPVKEEPKVEEPVIEVDEDDEKNKLEINRVPFAKKLLTLDKNVQSYYNTIYNYFSMHRKINPRVSKSCASFRFGRELVAKISVRGKTMKLHLALKVNDYDSALYFQKDMGDVKAYQEVPFTVKVKSERALKRALELIAALAVEKKIEKKTRFVDVDALVEIKEKAKEN